MTKPCKLIECAAKEEHGESASFLTTKANDVFLWRHPGISAENPYANAGCVSHLVLAVRLKNRRSCEIP